MESRNKREGWYAGKSYANCWKQPWKVIWDKRKSRTRSEYRRLRKPMRIDISQGYGVIENFRFISAEIIEDKSQIL